jgi:hypothetical protein
LRSRNSFLLSALLLVSACSSNGTSGESGDSTDAGGAPGQTGKGGATANGDSGPGSKTTTTGDAAVDSGSGGDPAGDSGGTNPTADSGPGGTTPVGDAGLDAGGTKPAGDAGGGLPPGASHLPIPSGTTNVPRPAGTGTKITSVHWAGFKGAVTYSFDDDNDSQIAHYSELNAIGAPYTFFMWTGRTEASNAIWKQAVKDGHEIGNHTQSHQNAGTTGDIDTATKFITTQFALTPWTLAAPNGAQVYSTLAKGRFFINRGVADGAIGPGDNTDPFTLPTLIPQPGTTGAQFSSWADSAVSAGTWRTMCVHGFQNASGQSTDGSFQAVVLANWLEGAKHARALPDLWIGTMTDVGAYWQGEKAFGIATTMTSGTEKTWTWTLPDKFPTGHYLRVTTDGGTLKQGGAVLTWDPHGYYEIALDAKSATLSN